MLKYGSISVFSALENIQSGKYVMPAFQRQYVWDMKQIENLWDSILQGYPISTFLYWHIDQNNVSSDTLFCDFMKNVNFSNSRKAEDVNYSLGEVDLQVSNHAILDGQQRLTSLYLSLFGEVHIKNKGNKGGSFPSRLYIELDKNNIGNESEFGALKYQIKFKEKIFKVEPTNFELKKIISEDFKNVETRQEEIENAIRFVPPDSKEYAREILNTLCQKIYDEQIIRYTEIFDMKQDDAVEMFVRFNSGGKPLKKSEVTMSMLEAYWPSAKFAFGKMLEAGSCFEGFGEDFILRTAHMIYGDVIKSNLSKSVSQNLKNHWEEFCQAFKNTYKLLKGLKIDIRRFKSSWNILVPIVYCVYYNPNFENYVAGVKAYICRALFFKYYRSGTTAKLQTLKNAIKAYNFEITIEMLELIDELSVKDSKIEDLLNYEKGGMTAEILHYLSLDFYNPKEVYDQDHIHPSDAFDKFQPLGVTAPTWEEWRKLKDKLPNLEYLSEYENEIKSNQQFEMYLEDIGFEKQQEHIKKHYIPEDVSYKISNFGDFFEKRKQILHTKIHQILTAEDVFLSKLKK